LSSGCWGCPMFYREYWILHQRNALPREDAFAALVYLMRAQIPDVFSKPDVLFHCTLAPAKALRSGEGARKPK
jgi:hypothetical protein